MFLGLALNPDKTEVLLLGSAAKLRHINCANVVNIAGADVSLVDSVKNLGVQIDSRRTFDKDVNNIWQASYCHIRALRHVRSSMSTNIAKSVASAIAGARLDYCNSLLYGVWAANLHKLQRVQNTLARVVTGTKNVIILRRISRHFIGYQLILELRIRSLFIRTKLNWQDNGVFIRVQSTFSTLLA